MRAICATETIASCKQSPFISSVVPVSLIQVVTMFHETFRVVCTINDYIALSFSPTSSDAYILHEQTYDDYAHKQTCASLFFSLHQADTSSEVESLCICIVIISWGYYIQRRSEIQDHHCILHKEGALIPYMERLLQKNG